MLGIAFFADQDFSCAGLGLKASGEIDYRRVNLLRNKEGVFGVVPPMVRGLMASSVRKGIRKALYAQGKGRHSRDEIYEIGKADLTAVSMWLGDKPFFMGTATSFDASAYSFLANILVPPLKSPLQDHGMSLPNL